MTFMTNDEWAVGMNYADFDTYITEHEVPVALTLSLHRENIHALIMEKLGGTPESGHENYLRGLEFTLVNNELDLLVFRTIQREVYSVERKRIIDAIDQSIISSMPDTTATRAYGWSR